MKPVQARILAKLTDAFQPEHINVLNESHMHSVPAGSESHFNVVLVSSQFAGRRQVQRHQAIYGVLAEELKTGVHALALHTYSPDEWCATQTVPESPQCLGGSVHDKQN